MHHGKEQGEGGGRYVTKMPEETNGMYYFLWRWQQVSFREIQKALFVVKADV